VCLGQGIAQETCASKAVDKTEASTIRSPAARRACSTAARLATPVRRSFMPRTALEMWELRQSLGFTDPLGIRDLEEPPNVRSYIMASTQHAAALPLRESAFCQQHSNPNTHTWTVRALLQGLTAWVKNGTEPPPSARPTIAAGTLVALREWAQA
jgi:hypothetical protein